MTDVGALVIDDDRDTRELLRDAIERAGYSVVTVPDGLAALEVLRVARPGVIFVDLIMPTMNGAEFRALQRRNLAWLSIPTIVMTGSPDEPMLDPAVAATLVKPVRAQEVVDLVRRYAPPAREEQPST